jgi:hypothetical protein
MADTWAACSAFFDFCKDDFLGAFLDDFLSAFFALRLFAGSLEPAPLSRQAMLAKGWNTTFLSRRNSLIAPAPVPVSQAGLRRRKGDLP